MCGAVNPGRSFEMVLKGDQLINCRRSMELKNSSAISYKLLST